ncbi:MAG TPA: hypothetical protein VF188_17360 [Longimicrobiales bacterium]
MRSHPARILLTSLAASVLFAACGAGPRSGLETRTFRLDYLDAQTAAGLIGPYVFTEGSEIRPVQGSVDALTIRERPEILDRIGATLAVYDRPRGQPSVRLRFQLIEADGFDDVDPAIAEVEGALRELFRFDGYRLLAEAVVSGARRYGEFQQHVTVDGEQYAISGQVWAIHDAADASDAAEAGTVRLDINLRNLTRHETVLEAEVEIPTDQTVVLGNGQTSGRDGTLILAVRPEVRGREGEGQGQG